MLVNTLFESFETAYKGRDNSLFGRLQFWSERIGHLDVNDLNADLIDQHLIELAQRGKLKTGRGMERGTPTGKPLAAGTLNRYRAALASVIKWAKGSRVRLLPRTWRSPLADIPSEPEAQGRLTYYTKDEINALVAAARCSAWHKLPALVLLAFVTGLRKGAITALRWGDIDLEAGRARIERMKNGDSHIAVLSPAVIAELTAIKPSKAEPEWLVFCGKKSPTVAHDFRHVYERAIEIAGLPRVVFHGIRHSCASHLARSNVSLVQIASVLNHRNFATTKRYAHLAVGDRAAVVSQHFD